MNIRAEFLPHRPSEILSQDEAKARSHEFLSKMKSRRSIRDFSSVPVDPQIIENAIAAAVCAPSGGNTQPWFFAAIYSPSLKLKLRQEAEAIEEQLYESKASQEFLRTLSSLGTTKVKKFLESAPVLIAVFYRNKDRYEDGNDKTCYYPKESVGLATGILLSALHLSGISTLTYTPKPMGFLNESLGLDKQLRPFLLVVAGYPKVPVLVPKIQKKEFHEIFKSF